MSQEIVENLTKEEIYLFRINLSHIPIENISDFKKKFNYGSTSIFSWIAKDPKFEIAP